MSVRAGIHQARRRPQYVNRAACRKMPLPDQAKKKNAPGPLVIEDVNNDAGVEKVGGHLPAATVVEPLVTLLAELLDPGRGAALEFGMILVFPGSGDIL